MRFDDVWSRNVSLERTTVPLPMRGRIKILKVDERGVLRLTSRGHRSRMSIASFERTVDALNKHGHLTREQILSLIRRWESSGVVATLAATGLYEITRDPVGLRVRSWSRPAEPKLGRETTPKRGR
jgi:hypothetical protein